MTCIICYGDDMQVITVREELTMGPDVVYVPIYSPNGLRWPCYEYAGTTTQGGPYHGNRM